MIEKDPQQQLQELLIKRKYDPTKPEPQQQILLTIGGKTVGTLQNYIVFSGLPKAGKSTFIHAAISSAFHAGETYGIKLHHFKKRKRFALFDTESSDFDFWQNIARIKQMGLVENLPAYFDPYSLREDSPGTIRKLIETYLQSNPDCAVIFVDGLLDLCINYNDERETRLLTNWLKRITKQYNILAICVLHLGKGAGQTLGHLGSNTDRWAQSTLIVEKEDQQNLFVLKPKFLRSSADFEPVAVTRINSEIVQVDYLHDAANNKAGLKKDPTQMELQTIAMQLFKNTKQYLYKDFIAAMQAATGQTAVRCRKFSTMMLNSEITFLDNNFIKIKN